MKSDIKIGWTVVAFLAALGLAMAISATVKADVPTLADKITGIVPSLTAKTGDTVDPAEFAQAVAAATESPQWAAFLVATAAHESGFRSRIARSEYKPREGDGGKAWGLFQNWKSAANADVWGSPDIAVQVKSASHLSRQYYNMCRGSGVPFPLSTFRALGGHGCKMPLKGEAERVRTYERVLRRIQ